MAKGSVDTNKIGSIGWSNGAILTMALVTQDSRFKAASAGAGGVEWTADTATCAFGLSFNDYYFGATPWADPERYRKMSPFWHMDRITTPVLLFQGSDDTAVPPHHAWMQLRLLQEYQKAPVRLVQLPGEPHSLKRPSSQRRKLQEELAWFDRHLFAATPEVSTVLKENSPLARRLELRKAARVGNRYGRSVMGKLVPEAVPYREVMVGRFEITRAQFAEFEPTYRVAVGQENHPAAGVSFRTAQAYAEWLSRLTGERWRLPRPDEAKNLYESSDSDSNPNENTLDHWTGYTANPEDTSRVLVEIQKLGGPTELLREVGSFPGRRDGDGPSVFDLGGNVAEWVTRVDGSGEPRGGRADWPSDAKTTQRDASPACVGFRVIRANPSTSRN